jgi:hypothetical protein
MTSARSATHSDTADQKPLELVIALGRGPLVLRLIAMAAQLQANLSCLRPHADFQIIT